MDVVRVRDVGSETGSVTNQIISLFTVRSFCCRALSNLSLHYHLPYICSSTAIFYIKSGLEIQEIQFVSKDADVRAIIVALSL